MSLGSRTWPNALSRPLVEGSEFVVQGEEFRVEGYFHSDGLWRASEGVSMYGRKCAWIIVPKGSIEKVQG